MNYIPINKVNSNEKYLFALLKSNNNNVYIIKEAIEILKNKSFNYLLHKWTKEENDTLKELLEIVIANKISISFKETTDKKIKKYLEKVTSLEAICILLQTNNKDILDYIEEKYNTLFDFYLKETEEKDNSLYQYEGNDLKTDGKNNYKIITFPKQLEKKEKKVKTKIYRFKK